MVSETATLSTVDVAGKQYRAVEEGKATILVPPDATIGGDAGGVQQVFYNPIQQYNRDLSVLAVKTYGEIVLRERQDRTAARKARQGQKRKRDEPENGELKHQQSQDDILNGGEDHGDDPSKPDKHSFRILDALSASGLRSLRYAHELPFVTSVVANDLSASAAESIRLNVQHNALDHKIHVTNDDALAYMYRNLAADLTKRDRRGNPTRSHKFDVVDLDPYGTAATFFDAAVQTVRDDGGLLAITCTDSALWAGHCYSEKTFALYGGLPVKGMHSHEAGLRLILQSLAASAARYGLDVQPLLSLSIDYYTKMFVRVYRSPAAVKFRGDKSMLVYGCEEGCGTWETQPLMRSKAKANKKGSGKFYVHSKAVGPTADRLCEHCGFKMHLSGPMYAGHLHSRAFIELLLAQIPRADPKIYKTLPRLEGMLHTALEELLEQEPPEQVENIKDMEAIVTDHHPFFVIPSKLAGTLSCQTPPEAMFRGALLHLGYQVGRSHCRAGSIKTDAPWSTLWWIMAEWIRQKSPIKAANISPTSPSASILRRAGLLPAGQGSKASTGSSTDANQDETLPMEESKLRADSDNKTNDVTHNDDTQVTPHEAERRKTLKFNQELANLASTNRTNTQRLVRWQQNPNRNWGPMSKAQGK